MTMRTILLLTMVAAPVAAQTPDSLLLLKPAAVWDGVSDAPINGWTASNGVSGLIANPGLAPSARMRRNACRIGGRYSSAMSTTVAVQPGTACGASP